MIYGKLKFGRYVKWYLPLPDAYHFCHYIRDISDNAKNVQASVWTGTLESNDGLIQHMTKHTTIHPFLTPAPPSLFPFGKYCQFRGCQIILNISLTTKHWRGRERLLSFFVTTLSLPFCIIRELKQNTTMTETRTSPNKSFNEQNNSCARAL